MRRLGSKYLAILRCLRRSISLQYLKSKEEIVLKPVKRLTTAFSILLALVLSGFAMGQTKLGYVDSQKILQTFPPALDAQKKLEAENNQWAQELQKMQEDLKALNDKLDQQSLLLSDAKKKEAAQEIQNLAIKAQQYQNERWGEEGKFFQRRKELLQPVFDKINAIINKIGEEDGYDFIFDTQAGNLLYAKSSHNLTDEVLARLEKEGGSAGTAAKTGTGN
jgi:outer membrane protein